MLRSTLLGLALLTTLAAAACSGSDEKDATPTAGNTQAAATPATNATASSSTAAGSATAATSQSTTAATTAATATQANPVKKVNANTATRAELQAAFEAAGISNAAQWAREVEEYRPYPTTDANFAKLRGELAKYNPGPGVVDKIVATLVP